MYEWGLMDRDCTDNGWPCQPARSQLLCTSDLPIFQPLPILPSCTCSPCAALLQALRTSPSAPRPIDLWGSARQTYSLPMVAAWWSPRIMRPPAPCQRCSIVSAAAELCCCTHAAGAIHFSCKWHSQHSSAISSALPCNLHLY